MSKLFGSWVIQPENLASVKDAINETAFSDEKLEKFVTIKKVKNNDPIALIGAMDMVGKKGGGCNPTFDEVGIANSLKRWELKEWQAPLKICYDAMAGTIAEYDLKVGSEIADISGTAIEDVYLDKLNTALQEMAWRFGWFGDTAAQNVTSGGKITDGVSVDKFNVCDGLFKRLFEVGTNNAAQVTSIAANSKTTTAEQKSALLTNGTATDLVDTILMNADSRIVDDADSVLMLTRSLADALTYDIKKTYNVIMPWEKVFDGFETATYNGIKIARVSIWDRFINAYEKGAKALNKPHRAVFCNPKQLMIGTDTGGAIDSLNNWYNPDTREYRIDIQGKMATQILEENLVHLAY